MTCCNETMKSNESIQKLLLHLVIAIPYFDNQQKNICNVVAMIVEYLGQIRDTRLSLVSSNFFLPINFMCIVLGNVQGQCANCKFDFCTFNHHKLFFWIHNMMDFQEVTRTNLTRKKRRSRKALQKYMISSFLLELIGY